MKIRARECRAEIFVDAGTEAAVVAAVPLPLRLLVLQARSVVVMVALLSFQVSHESRRPAFPSAFHVANAPRRSMYGADLSGARVEAKPGTAQHSYRCNNIVSMI